MYVSSTPPQTKRSAQFPAQDFKSKPLETIPETGLFKSSKAVDPAAERLSELAKKANLESNLSLGGQRPSRQASNLSKINAVKPTPLTTVSE